MEEIEDIKEDYNIRRRILEKEEKEFEERQEQIKRNKLLAE